MKVKNTDDFGSMAVNMAGVILPTVYVWIHFGALAGVATAFLLLRLGVE